MVVATFYDFWCSKMELRLGKSRKIDRKDFQIFRYSNLEKIENIPNSFRVDSRREPEMHTRNAKSLRTIILILICYARFSGEK